MIKTCTYLFYISAGSRRYRPVDPAQQKVWPATGHWPAMAGTGTWRIPDTVDLLWQVPAGTCQGSGLVKNSSSATDQAYCYVRKLVECFLSCISNSVWLGSGRVTLSSTWPKPSPKPEPDSFGFGFPTESGFGFTISRVRNYYCTISFNLMVTGHRALKSWKKIGGHRSHWKILNPYELLTPKFNFQELLIWKFNLKNDFIETFLIIIL